MKERYENFISEFARIAKVSESDVHKIFYDCGVDVEELCDAETEEEFNDWLTDFKEILTARIVSLNHYRDALYEVIWKGV